MFEDIECKHKTLFSPHKNMMNFCELLQTLQYNNYSIDFWHVYEVLKHFFSNKKTDDF